MKRLSQLVTSATPGPGVQFRRQAYGSGNIRDFLRDTMAIANASVDGGRYIVIGADFDSQGRKRVHQVADKDFSDKPGYLSLVEEYIEPALRVTYVPVVVDGKQLGVFEIGDCRDRPYMMRIDFSEELRRGDAYMRVKDSAIKMGRRQLQMLFEKKFRDSVSGSDVEIGFAGSIIHKYLDIDCCDLAELPSAVAASKLEQLIKVRLNSRNTGSTSIMARLVHARLFGSDDPYVSRTPDELLQEMEEIRQKYEDQDREFLFETNAQKIQLVILNQGLEPIVNASLSLVLPNDPEFYVADKLPRTQQGSCPVEATADEASEYPTVRLLNNSIHISCKVNDIPVGDPVEVFGLPLRVCPGPGLRGRKFGIRYVMQGKNLRSPAKGQLRLRFRK